MFRRYFVIASSDGVGPILPENTANYYACFWLSVLTTEKGVEEGGGGGGGGWKPNTRTSLINQQNYKVPVHVPETVMNFCQDSWYVGTANTYQHMFYCFIY